MRIACFHTERCQCTTVRRYRFRLDVAYTCLVRRRLRSWIDNDIPFIIVLLFDASPRSGREWLLGEIYIIREDMLEAFEAAMWELADMRARSRAGSDTFDENLAQQLEATMYKAVWHVILTPSCLGAKAAGGGNEICIEYPCAPFAVGWLAYGQSVDSLLHLHV